MKQVITFRCMPNWFGKAVAIIAFFPMAAFGQSNFDGSWQGQVQVEKESRAKAFTLVIASNKVVDHLDPHQKKNWMTNVKVQNTVHEKMLVYEWQKLAKFGAETETFSLTLIHADTLQVNWLRRCVIHAIKGYKDDTWTLAGSGLLVRTTEAEKH